MLPIRQVITRQAMPCFEEFVDSFVRRSRPLLVRNCFQNWCDSWTVDALRQRLRGDDQGDDEGRILIPSPVGANVVARCQPDEATVKELQQQSHTESTAPVATNTQAAGPSKDQGEGQMLIPQPPGVNYVSQYKSQEIELPTSTALQQFVQRSRSEDNPQGCQCRLDPGVFWDPDTDELPTMLQDERFEIVYDNSFVWITSKSLRTSLHPDPDEGVIAHLAGHKKALLISPVGRSKEDLDELFKYRWRSGTIADLYLNGKGFASTITEKYLVDLNPGDMLYIPKSWLHDIESTDETVSLVTRFEIGTPT